MAVALKDLLQLHQIAPERTVVLRHRPAESIFYRVLPMLAARQPALFNAYQQTQGPKLERTMQAVTHVVSFIGHAPGKAIFVGLYTIEGWRPLTYEAYTELPAYAKLREYGWRDSTLEEVKARGSILWFDLALSDHLKDWHGKLVVGWPPPERSWWRRAHRNIMPVLSVLEESAFEPAMPRWDELVVDWAELALLPARWKVLLSQWRGIYLIYDTSDGKRYVGSAYGADNLLGRWTTYADTGHGGNLHLRHRDPRLFRFSVLQRLSPDTPPDEVIRIETTWKARLHTRHPDGLNEN